MKTKIRRCTIIFSFIGLVSLVSCNSDINYSITEKQLDKPANCSCQINYRYPEIKSRNKADSKLIALNNALKSVGEFETFIDRCNPKSPQFMKAFKKYDCDYNITLQTDSMLSIEIQNTAYYNDDFKYTRFNSFLLNTKNWTQIPLENLFNGLDRGKIYPFIVDYNKRTGKNINLLAYQSKSNYALTYGMTRDSLVIYVGGEGEWFGNDKVFIPIKKLLK